MAKTSTSRLEPGKKRKWKGEISHVSKKSRMVVLDSPQEVDFHDQALQLEEEILKSPTNYNSIHTLQEYLQGNDGAENDGAENDDTIAAVALCRVFCRLMARGNLSKLRESFGNEATIVQWLRERLQDYEHGLLRMVGNGNVAKQRTALTVVMRLVKKKASDLNQSEDAVWQGGLFGQLVQTLVEKKIAEEVRAEFVEEYVERYDDVRYYTFACLA